MKITNRQQGDYSTNPSARKDGGASYSFRDKRTYPKVYFYFLTRYRSLYPYPALGCSIVLWYYAIEIFLYVADESLIVEHDVLAQYLCVTQHIVHAASCNAIVGGAERVLGIHLQWRVATGLVVLHLHLGDACLAHGLGVEYEAETRKLGKLTVLFGRVGSCGNKKLDRKSVV